MKGVRHELFALLTVLSVPVAIVLAFPFSAVSFTPRQLSGRCSPSAAFVVITPAEQEQAMRSAKSSWQGDAGGVRRLRADLSVGVLPENDKSISADVGAEPSRSAATRVDYVPAAYPPSQGALPAGRLPKAETETAREPAFPKSELLKID